MSFFRRQYKRMQKVYLGLIALQVLLIIVSLLGIWKLNGELSSELVSDDLFETNLIYMIFILSYPVMGFFALKPLRDGKELQLLDSRLKLAKEEEGLVKRNSLIITYFYMRGLISLPIFALGFVMILRTIFDTGDNEWIYFAFGLAAMGANLLITLRNYPKTAKLFEYSKQKAKTTEDVERIIEQIQKLEE